MRLNRYIASCGAASRRGADALVEAGRVTVDGCVVKTHGMDIDIHAAVVCIDGVRVSMEQAKVYIMLNKPAGVLSTCHDDRGRKTVLDIVSSVDARLFPVGRLDYDTEGLLLMTNDGDFAYRLTHPSHEQDKTYYAEVSGEISSSVLGRLEQGVEIDGRFTSNAKIRIIHKEKGLTKLTITIHEGRNRQIRKMFGAVGCHVSYLKRIAVGKLTLGHLASGQWRYLTDKDFTELGYNQLEEKDEG